MKVSSQYNIQVPKTLEDNLEWRKRIFKRVREDRSYINVLKHCCKSDPLFFINGFGWTYDPRLEPNTNVPFILYDCQEEAIIEIIRSFNNEDFLIEKSRDMGASWCCISSVTWAWSFYSGLSFLFVSRVEDYVDKKDNPKAMFYKHDYIVSHCPTWLRPLGYNLNIHRTSMHAINPELNSVIDGESTNRNVGSGDRRTAVVLDEFAKVEQGYSVLSSTRPVSNCRGFNSTPAGINNAFYDLTTTNIKKIRLHWTRHPEKMKGAYYIKDKQYVLIDKEYWHGIEDIEKKLIELDKKIIDKNVPLPDEKVRSPWYALQCERAANAEEIAQEEDIDYLGSGKQFFNANIIQNIITKHCFPPNYVGNLSYDVYTGDPISFREDEEGNLRIWCVLNRELVCNIDHKFVVACDIGTGSGASNSTASIWDCNLSEKVAEYANSRITPEDFSRQAVALAKFFNHAKINYDSFGPGSSFGQKVQDIGYHNLYKRKDDPTFTGQCSDNPGYPMNMEAKTIALSAYRDAIEKEWCINHSKVSLEECLEYIYGIDGTPTHARASNKLDPSGAKKNHGDRVVADALAWKELSIKRTYIKDTPIEVPIGSLAWRNKVKEEARRKKVKSSCNW